MKVSILKGTNQIGGCITEITSDKGTKIIVDYGDNLDDEKQITIPGLTKKDDLKASYDGVIITHSHKDHIGCASLIKKEIPIYVNKEGMEIHNNLCYFTKEYEKVLRKKDNTIKFFEFEKSFFINDDIKITPFIADHSSYNSAMILIEADGQKILHTGDFRNHGKKGCLFNKILNEIGEVDLLITEGTTIGSSKRNFKKESDLSKDFQELTKYNQIYVMCSSTNIDRIVNLYKNFSKTHLFIMDMCMNSTTSLLKKIPNSNTFNNVYTFVSPNQKKIDKPYGDAIKRTKKVIYELPFNEKFVVSIKQSMSGYLKDHKEDIKNACLIYSMWDGYIKDDWKDPKLREFKNYLINELHMDYFPIHTSGHASMEAIKTLDKIVNPRKAIIIHTKKNKETIKIEKEIFQNRLLKFKDGEVIDLKDKDKKMKIYNYDIKDLRKRYARSEDFIIKIRDQDKENNSDIVYYNGIKSFSMKSDKTDKSIAISLTDDIYKLNRSNIENIIGKEKDATKIEDLIQGIKDVRTNMKKYVGVHLSSIKLRIGSVFYKGGKGKSYKEIQQEVYERLEKINKELECYDLKMDIQNIMQNFAINCCEQLKEFLKTHPDLLDDSTNVNENNVYEIINKLFEEHKDILKEIKVDTGLQINNPLIEDDLKIEKIFILNTIFKEDLIYSNKTGFKIPEFTFKMLNDEKCDWKNDLEDKINKFDNTKKDIINKNEKNIGEELEKKLNEFDDAIKDAIDKYEENTGEELEKKYQHLFMLENKLQFYPNLSTVIPFEEEYYTEEKSSKENSNDKKGRIDCIFVDTKEKQSDIYLIELKVNDAVIGSPGSKGSDEHGINIHLIDINELLNNKAKIESFINKLIYRYNYRNDMLNNSSRITNAKNCILHYWIICAIKGKDEDDEKIQAVKVMKKIEKLKEDGDNTCAELLKTGKACLKSKASDINCDIKLLFNVWKDDEKTEFLEINEFENRYIKEKF